MIDVLRSSQDLFLRDLQVPVQLSEAYAYLLLNIITIDSYIVGSNLVYIVKIPLSTHFVYDIYRVIPFPMRINNTRFKYTFIQPEQEYVLMDSTRQFYAKLKHENIGECRKMSKEQIICKQNFPLLMSHLTNDCKILMLQPIRLVPKTCSQRVLELKETLWIPFKDNSWLYVAPVPSQMTVICSGQEPMDVELKDIGILTFLADCTGYSDKAILKSVTTHYINKHPKVYYSPVIFTC
jgi:hypothetical protein